MNTVITAEIFQLMQDDERQHEIDRYSKLPLRLQSLDFHERIEAALSAMTDEQKASML